MASLERLYDLYNIIQEAGVTGRKHESEYVEILSGVKGDASMRKLASQFIAKFFHFFPNYQEKALNAQFDLCEDEDVLVRRQAIKEFPVICKANVSFIPKVSDILAQLLQMDDAGEISTIQNSLTALIKLDAKGTLTGIFYQIKNSEDEVVRERALKFILNKVTSFGADVFKPEIEDFVFQECTSVPESVDLSGEEFKLLMSVLSELRCAKMVKGYQKMVDIVAEQVDLTAALSASDLESFHRFCSCVKLALPFFSSQVRSTKFVDYMCREIVPHLNNLDEVRPALNGNGAAAAPASSLSLDLLQVLSELISSADFLDDIDARINVIYAQLLHLMPLPLNEDVSVEAESVNLEFSRVECLLYVFHRLAKLKPEFLSENAERLKDFRSRLQYFARVSQAYQKKLKESVANKRPELLKREENKIKLVAIKTTTNINTLIRDLFHQPPSYKSSISLSWKVLGAKSSEKRHTPITFDAPEGKKSGREIYTPPRNKFSQNAGTFRFQGRSRGRGRGGYRNFGRARGGSFRRY